MEKVITDSEAVAKIIYGTNPAIFTDRVDGECVIPWHQAQLDRPAEYDNALLKAGEICTAPYPQAELLSLIGRDALLGEMADFTWYFGTDWLVETRFGNFHWKDPDYGDGDNSFTLFEGDYIEFRDRVGVGFGRDKGRHLISSYCGNNIELKIPQLIV